MDTKHEVHQIADALENPPMNLYYAANLLRRQHARIEELERALDRVVTQNEHDMVLTGDECRSARALLTKKD